jgi:hypothetical protein
MWYDSSDEDQILFHQGQRMHRKSAGEDPFDRMIQVFEKENQVHAFNCMISLIGNFFFSFSLSLSLGAIAP